MPIVDAVDLLEYDLDKPVNPGFQQLSEMTWTVAAGGTGRHDVHRRAHSQGGRRGPHQAR
jgi:hypothetical protein